MGKTIINILKNQSVKNTRLAQHIMTHLRIFGLNNEQTSLIFALFLSILIHTCLLLDFKKQTIKSPPKKQLIQVEIKSPPAPVIPTPTLKLPEQEIVVGDAGATKPKRPDVKPDKPKPINSWTQVVKKHLDKLKRTGFLYPPEAASQGLEGEALVLVFIENGKVVASRIEQSSGESILDDAALRAVRSLPVLSADAPPEAVLSVKFRLQ